MSSINGLNGREGTAISALRRCVPNLTMAISLLARPPRVGQRQIPWFSSRAFAVMGGIAVVVLVSMFTLDAAVIRGVAHVPRWVISVFHEITEFGKSGWFLWPLGVLFLVLAALPPVLTPFSQRVLAVIMVRVGFLFAAIAVPSLFATVVKRIIGRARPYVGGTLDPLLFSPFAWVPAYAGMPSGHATTAFAVLVAFGSLWPRARTILLVYAVLICISRPMVIAHYPSDVLAGALVGIAGAMMVRRYFADRGLGFSINPNGRILQFPGPSLRRIKAVARGLLAP
jgi:membrane-associated phospholipid phosphatase